MSLDVIAIGVFPLGWLFGGAVAEWLGNEEALVISALLGTPVAVMALLLSKELRRLDVRWVRGDRGNLAHSLRENRLDVGRISRLPVAISRVERSGAEGSPMRQAKDQPGA
jgi:hypothetical protein